MLPDLAVAQILHGAVLCYRHEVGTRQREITSRLDRVRSPPTLVPSTMPKQTVQPELRRSPNRSTEWRK